MDFNHATEEELRDMRKWFFKENIRIQQEKASLEEEKRRLQQEKDECQRQKDSLAAKNQIARRQMERDRKLFDAKWKLLESELVKLAEERKIFEQEKQQFQPLVGQAERMQQCELFFVGVNSSTSLRKRYKDLLKIFHPDNMNGDTSTLQAINQEYDSLKKIFTGTA